MPINLRKLFSFTDYVRSRPSAPLPGERLDAELAALRKGILDVSRQVDTILNEDADARLRAQRIDARESGQARAATPQAIEGTVLSGAGSSEDWANVSYHWAEYFDGNSTIPMDILAQTQVSGDHWSARWWAHRASQIVGDAVDGAYHYYIGPSDRAPTATLSGDPLIAGCLYFDTTSNQMMIWDGSQWQPITGAGTGGSTFAGIAYSEFQYTAATAGETTFGGADNYGNVPPDFTDSNTNTNVFVNGVRLVEQENWYVLSATQIELVRGVAAGSSVTVECYGVSDSAGSLVPSATTHLRCDYAAVSAGQTNFSGVDNYGRTLKGLMIPGAIIDVHVNGVLLEEDAYTVVSDSELALVRGVALGSGVSIEVMTVAGDSGGGVVAEHDHDCGEFI